MDQNLTSPPTWLYFRKLNGTILHWWLYNPVFPWTQKSPVSLEEITFALHSAIDVDTLSKHSNLLVWPSSCRYSADTHPPLRDRAAAQLSPSLANRRSQSCPHTSASFRKSLQQSGTSHMKATLALQSSLPAWYLPYKLCLMFRLLRKTICLMGPKHPRSPEVPRLMANMLALS